MSFIEQLTATEPGRMVFLPREFRFGVKQRTGTKAHLFKGGDRYPICSKWFPTESNLAFLPYRALIEWNVCKACFQQFQKRGSRQILEKQAFDGLFSITAKGLVFWQRQMLWRPKKSDRFTVHRIYANYVDVLRVEDTPRFSYVMASVLIEKFWDYFSPQGDVR